MRDPNRHSSAAVPTLLAGGKNVPFRFGRRIQLSGRCGTPNDACMSKLAANANNHLLVAIAQAFGVQVEAYGHHSDPAFTTGALDGLT